MRVFKRLLASQIQPGVVLGLVFAMAIACSNGGGTSAVKPETDARAAVAKSTATEPSYTTLREWHPNNEPNGLGLDILLSGQVTEQGVVDLVERLSRGRDPVNIRGFVTRAAYDEEQAGALTAEYDRGYLFFYVKNTTGRGVYKGFNEVRWMQAEGEFSQLFGQKTKL